jgi:CNT family concentrative nucleoside transporter
VSAAEKVDLAGLEASGGLVPVGRGIAAADGAQAGAEGPLQMASFDTPLSVRLRSLAGLLLLVGLAWGLSVNRKLVPWRVVLWGLGLQLLFAVAVLKTGAGQAAFAAAGDVVVTLLGFTAEGARMVFGDLVYDTVPIGTGSVGQGGFEALPGQVARTGASFAFSVLPTIIFFSSLMAVLYHLGIMQLAVRGVAWVMQRTMRTSGAETLSAAGNVFVGMTEAPLLVKPFVERMTNSELMAVMTGGFATVAGGVMAAYVSFLYPFVPGIAGHLIAASVMSAPAALLVAKVMMPEEAVPETVDVAGLTVERSDANVIDAAARGAGKGLELALNVGAMLLAFVALIQLANGVLGWAGSLVGWDGLAFEVLLGWVLAPLAWMMGVSWADAPTIGGLLGVKTILNEFVAYVQLTDMVAGGRSLEPRSVVIATYALSGFANFGSIAMQLGGIGGIAPSRRSDLARLGVRAMIGGSIAAFMTASVAGMLL